MTKRNNMYALSVKQWNPWVGCEHDCRYCRPSFQAQLKRRRNKCPDCYSFVPHGHPSRLQNQRFPKTGFMQFIFTCSSGDIAFCPDNYLQQIVAEIRRHKDRTFLLQTKDPTVFQRTKFPDNVILGITLETNKDALAQAVSKAPPPSQRRKVFKTVEHARKMLTIEPVMDFDLDTMIQWIDDLAPCMVWLGYDSKRANLPEPPLAQVKELSWELGRRGLVVVLKTIRDARRSDQPSGRTAPKRAGQVYALSASTATQDWDEAALRQWASTARPNSRLAMWILAHGLEKTVKELNAAAVSAGLQDAKGAIVGGIQAAAKRKGLTHPLEQRRVDGEKKFIMRDELQPVFRHLLKDHPEASLIPAPA